MTVFAKYVRMQRDTAAHLVGVTLDTAEFAQETDTAKLKLGDGSTTYASLGYVLGGVAGDSIFTTKGDLPVGTGSATAVRLGVGADNTVLTADSTQTTGLAWKKIVTIT